MDNTIVISNKGPDAIVVLHGNETTNFDNAPMTHVGPNQFTEITIDDNEGLVIMSGTGFKDALEREAAERVIADNAPKPELDHDPVADAEAQELPTFQEKPPLPDRPADPNEKIEGVPGTGTVLHRA